MKRSCKNKKKPISAVDCGTLYSLLFVALMLQCSGDTVILSYLSNSSIAVILKGSYASDAPLPFAEINGNAIYQDNDDQELNGICDAVASSRTTNRACLTSPNNSSVFTLENLPIYMDFAGVRLSKSSSDLASINNIQRTDEFWHILSNERQVYCSHPENLTEGNVCASQDGVGKLTRFFNGEGALLPSTITESGDFIQAGLFIRRLTFGYGTLVSTTFATDNNGRRTGNETVTSTGTIATNFDGSTLSGRDIVPIIGFLPGSGAPIANTALSQVFPILFRAEEGQALRLENSFEPAVLEFRIGLKEILSYHSFRQNNLSNFVECNDADAQETWAANTTITSNYEFIIAPSDWRIKHNVNCLNNEWGVRMGGNLLSRARVFYPLQTTNLILVNTGSNPTTRMYALFRAEEPAIDRDAFTPIDPTHATMASRTDTFENLPRVLPLAATPARAGTSTNKNNQLRYIMPGSYILQCRADSNSDGYPEAIMSTMNVTVPTKAANTQSDLSEMVISFNC